MESAGRPAGVAAQHLRLSRSATCRSRCSQVFDLPDLNMSYGARNVSTVPTQALTLMNNEFVMRQAQLLADRVKTMAGSDTAKQIDTAYRMALTRPPTRRRLTLARELVEGRLARRLHARAAEPERVPLHGVTAMTQTTSVPGAISCSSPGGGISGLALAYLLNQDGLLARCAGDACRRQRATAIRSLPK